MDMQSSSSMVDMAPTTSAGISMATGTSMDSMGGMDMGSGACKISMLWNWYTVDSCKPGLPLTTSLQILPAFLNPFTISPQPFPSFDLFDISSRFC